MKPIEAASCCTPQDTAAKAATAMRDSGCGCSPVVENAKNLKLVGVVTERDICHSVAAEDVKASDVSVEKIMGSASSCCGADDSLEETERKLHEHKTTSLPVVDAGGSCCGTVSLHHIRENGEAVTA
ncbi:MAG: CBS domain-containing protein [Pyrinomonadaceae bacterium]